MASLTDRIHELEQHVKQLTERFAEMGYDTKAIVQSEIKTRWKIPGQSESLFGLYTAICVQTSDDPHTNYAVRFFSPLLHSPGLAVEQLPFAYPISAAGGFDDSGLVSVPPAGSKVVIQFEAGNPQMPYYHGTAWDIDRGASGQENWGYPVPEFYQYHTNRGQGYMVGPADGSQVKGPFNTENYNRFDATSKTDLETSEEPLTNPTPPYIAGWKTVGKNMIQMGDGDPARDHRWGRFILQSATGGWLMFKDDPHNPCGAWANPKCGSGENQYHKHESECRPYRGPQTPQNTRCELEQVGMQLQSYGGAALIFHDKVDGPDYSPDWTASLKAFKFGRGDRAECYTKLVSVTGHEIMMDDTEDQSGVRSQENGIRLRSACGVYLSLLDHTQHCPCGQDSADALAGSNRGLRAGTTSGHVFEMMDVDNRQCSCRKGGGEVTPNAENAYVRLRTGYGLEILMADYNSQEKTQQQFLRLTCPQKDSDCGPHYIIMQEDPNGGQVFIRAGGDFVTSSAGHQMFVAGGDCEEQECKGPASIIMQSSQHHIQKCCEYSVDKCKVRYVLADDVIVLGAGQECPIPDTDPAESGPCYGPVLVYDPATAAVRISTKVIGSFAKDDSFLSIFNLDPFRPGRTEEEPQ